MCSANLGFSVRSANRIRPKNGIPMPVYIYIVFENKHTHSKVRVTTAASETEGVAAVSWIESWIEYVTGTSERFVANCGVGPSTRGQGDSASLVKPTQDQRR